MAERRYDEETVIVSPRAALEARRELRRARPPPAHGAGHRRPVDRAAADRDPFPEARVRAARRDRELPSRPRGPEDPRGPRPRHRRSQAPRPRRPPRHYPDAPQVERKLRGVSRLRARRPPPRPTGPWQGQLGPDRQAASAAEQQAVRAPKFLARRRRQQHRAGNSVRAGGGGAAGQRPAERRLQGPPVAGQPPAGSGALRGENLHTNAAVAVVARRPGIDGPITLDRFACPQSRFQVLAPRFDAKASFNEGFTSIDGSGRMAMQSLTAGTNGLAAFAGELTYKGPLTNVQGRVKLAAQKSRLGTIYADRTRLERWLRPRNSRAGTFDFGRGLRRRQRQPRPVDDRGCQRAACGGGEDSDRPGRDQHRQRDQADRRQFQHLGRDHGWSTSPAAARRGSRTRDIKGPNGAHARNLRRKRSHLLLARGRPADRRQYRNGRRRPAERAGDAFASRDPARR